MKKIIIALVAVAAGYAIGMMPLVYKITECAHKHNNVTFSEVDKEHIRVICGSDDKIFRI